MANLAASAVTIENAWTEGNPSGKRVSCRQVTLVLTGQGGATNKIPASVLQLSVVEQATAFVKSDSGFVVGASPSYDGSLLYLVLFSGDAPSDITGTYRGVVKGYL